MTTFKLLPLFALRLPFMLVDLLEIPVLTDFLRCKRRPLTEWKQFSHLASARVALTIAHTATKTAGTPEIYNHNKMISGTGIILFH